MTYIVSGGALNSTHSPCCTTALWWWPLKILHHTGEYQISTCSADWLWSHIRHQRMSKCKTWKVVLVLLSFLVCRQLKMWSIYVNTDDKEIWFTEISIVMNCVQNLLTNGFFQPAFKNGLSTSLRWLETTVFHNSESNGKLGRRISVCGFCQVITIIVWTCEMSRKSWLTSIIPPSKSLMASARASIVSMSRWLVGSSSSSRWGRCQASHAKMTRQRWPSDRLRIVQVWTTVTHTHTHLSIPNSSAVCCRL